MDRKNISCYLDLMKFKNFFFLVFLVCANFSAKSIEQDKNLPRFVSIKATEANLRKGPGIEYVSIAIYNFKGFPVQIIDEYEDWRQVKDPFGGTGWMHSSVLSNKRTIIVITNGTTPLYKNDSLKSEVIAKLSENLVCSLKKCSSDLCQVTCNDYTGWVSKKTIWGVHVNEGS